MRCIVQKVDMRGEVLEEHVARCVCWIKDGGSRGFKVSWPGLTDEARPGGFARRPCAYKPCMVQIVPLPKAQFVYIPSYHSMHIIQDIAPRSS